MIYCELKDKASGKILDKAIFYTVEEAGYADLEAREKGQFYSGTLLTNIALNRYRHNRCPYCGVNAGEYHQNCERGVVQQDPNNWKDITW
jgi:hypothetical protein